VADTVLNRPFKCHNMSEFMSWAAKYVQAELKAGKQAGDIKMELLVGPLRDANVVWVVAAWRHLKTLREGILVGYKKAGTGMDAQLSYLKFSKATGVEGRKKSTCGPL
jgi:hypothetical protein